MQIFFSLGRQSTVFARQVRANMSPLSCTELQGAAPFHGRILCEDYIYQVKIYIYTLKSIFLTLYIKSCLKDLFFFSHESLYYFCLQDKNPGSSDDIHACSGFCNESVIPWPNPHLSVCLAHLLESNNNALLFYLKNSRTNGYLHAKSICSVS